MINFCRINRGKVHRVAGQLPYQIPVDGRYGVVADGKNSAALKYPPVMRGAGQQLRRIDPRVELLLIAEGCNHLRQQHCPCSLRSSQRSNPDGEPLILRPVTHPHIPAEV